MKLQPVYVLAPKQQRTPAWTRRSLLLAGAAFLAGTGVGAFAVSLSGGPSNAAPPADPVLAWLRMLADERTPTRDLAANAQRFLLHLDSSYPHDELLWQGAVRLARAVVEDVTLADRQLLARLLTVIFESHDRSALAGDALLAQLRAVR